MMQTRFRKVFVALGPFLLARAALAQEPADPAPEAKPQQKRAPAAATAADAAATPAAKPAAPAEADPPAASEEEATGEKADVPAAEPSEPSAAPSLPPAAPPAAAQAGALPTLPEPGADAAALQRMGRDRPAPVRPANDTDVFAEDWWSHARPILELHGNFRVRAEMFYRFSLGRVDQPQAAMWPRPPDSPYSAYPTGRALGSNLCTQEEADAGSSTSLSDLVGCANNTQAGANLRFRLNPEIHVSDNLRVLSQIDLLDNLVLGSTPSPRSGYEPLGFNSQTTELSVANSIRVKRVWGEYSTPVGELRFGRMPNHWGLGMVNHSGDGHDADYQSTIDRLQFVTGIKPLDLYVSGAWDFPNEGQTNAALSGLSVDPSKDDARARPLARMYDQSYDLAQLDDVDQYVVSVVRKKSPELTRLALTRGNLVINGGLQLAYRKQLLAAESSNAVSNPMAANSTEAVSGGQFVRRDAHYWLPDLWLQILYKGFRFEAEVATVQGSIGYGDAQTTGLLDTDKYTLAQWGLVTEIEQRLVENRLRLGFGFGWASGDADVDGLVPTAKEDRVAPPFDQIGGDRTLSTFRFNPAYRTDLILSRNILSRVQGTYYFRPSLAYDFMRDATGQTLGGSVAGIWTRASQFIQAPGHERDLGLELNGAVYFQSKDGAANDDPAQMGGFYARLEYGILFPMAGLGYPAGTRASIKNESPGRSTDVSNAQILRLYLGVLF